MLTIVLILASPVIGALVYALGVSRSNRPVRVVGAAIAIGSLPAAAAIVGFSID